MTDTDLAAILRRRDELKRIDPGAVLMFRTTNHNGDSYAVLAEDGFGLRGLPLVSRYCISGVEVIGFAVAYLDRVRVRLDDTGSRVVLIESPAVELDRQLRN